MVNVDSALYAALTAGAAVLTPSPSPSPSSESPHTSAPVPPVPTQGLGVLGWIAVISLPVAVAGVIFTYLMWRQGVAARKTSKVADARAADLEQQAARARQREQKAAVYRRLHQLALHRGDQRAYHSRQRFTMVDSDGEPIEDAPPEPPLSHDELQSL